MRCKGFADLADLPEDDRIKIIGDWVMSKRHRVAVPTDDDPGKAGRYMQKLHDRYPGIRCHIEPGLVQKTVTIIVQPPESSTN